MNPVSAAGGVLFKPGKGEARVLLIFRRGVWDLPKGKQEDGESIVECARREVAEEVGCPPPEVYDQIATTYHEYEERDARIGKTTHWFAMKTKKDSGFEPETREGIERVKWHPLKAAKEKVGFENLRTVLSEFEAWYKQRAGTT